MRLVFLGPPGGGKGTQADVICKKLSVPHISTGDILRRAVADDTELGREAKKYMDIGDLVPDEMIVRLVAERLGSGDCSRGFVLDGFPRTIAQAEALDGALSNSGDQLDFVVYFETTEKTIVERLTGRRICKDCGANYHVRNLKPKVEGICDKCGGELYQRQDDRLETIKQRIRVYDEETKELIDYYGQKGILAEVPGDSSVSELTEMLLGMLKQRVG